MDSPDCSRGRAHDGTSPTSSSSIQINKSASPLPGIQLCYSLVPSASVQVPSNTRAVSFGLLLLVVFTGALCLFVFIKWPFVLYYLLVFTGPLFAWIKWPSERRNSELPVWRRRTMSVGLFLITIQTVLFWAMWAPRSAVYRYHVLYSVEHQAPIFIIILVLPTLPCILIWRGPARWFLLGTELLLPILGFGKLMELFGAV